ncbi:MAG: hypothetical protein AB7I68_04435 [Porticoccaceae bacterium]
MDDLISFGNIMMTVAVALHAAATPHATHCIKLMLVTASGDPS